MSHAGAVTVSSNRHTHLVCSAFNHVPCVNETSAMGFVHAVYTIVGKTYREVIPIHFWSCLYKAGE